MYRSARGAIIAWRQSSPAFTAGTARPTRGWDVRVLRDTRVQIPARRASGSSSPVTSDLALSYGVLQAVTTDLALSYSVLGAVQADLGCSYSVRAPVQADAAIAYTVLAAVQADLALAYSIDSATTVSSDLALAYGVTAASYTAMNAVSADLALAYSMSGTVAGDLAVTYTVDAPSTIRRPNSDILTTGWTAVPGGSLYSTLDEASADDGDYITRAQAGTEPAVFGIPSLPSGANTIRIRASATSGSGQVRVLLLDGSGSTVGTSAWQSIDATPTTYALSVVASAAAERVRIEAS